jgi:hypothetical protein
MTMTLGPNEPTHDPITHRPTRAFIQAQAQDHVAYGWSARPGTWDRNIEWTDEDTAIYVVEYRTAVAKAKGRL